MVVFIFSFSSTAHIGPPHHVDILEKMVCDRKSRPYVINIVPVILECTDKTRSIFKPWFKFWKHSKMPILLSKNDRFLCNAHAYIDRQLCRPAAGCKIKTVQSFYIDFCFCFQMRDKSYCKYHRDIRGRKRNRFGRCCKNQELKCSMFAQLLISIPSLDL